MDMPQQREYRFSGWTRAGDMRSISSGVIIRAADADHDDIGPETASPTDEATDAPSAASGRHFASERFNTVRSWPFLAMALASADLMAPSPIMLTVWTSLTESPDHLPRRWVRRRTPRFA